MRLITRVFLSAIAFTVILPLIPGISFHGDIFAAAEISLVFSAMLSAVEAAVTALAVACTIASLGLAVLIIIPLWILGFWLLPVAALVLTSFLLPENLSVGGFQPAALAAFVLLGITLATSKIFWKK